MAWRSGSLSRTLVNTARSSPLRPPSTSSALPRLRPPPSFQANRLHPPRRLLLTNPRTLGELGCAQSLMPLHSVVADARLTSHVTVDARACCELSQGTFRRTCQDR
ncbi:hypothetical protein Ancab_025945 [Ancistrocladus abbreviatus]